VHDARAAGIVPNSLSVFFIVMHIGCLKVHTIGAQAEYATGKSAP
jgi:hypothetical protein